MGNRRTLKGAVWILAGSLCFLTGCAASGNKEVSGKAETVQQQETEKRLEDGFLKMTEEFESNYLPLDQMSADYMAGLEAVELYLQNPTEEERVKALRSVQDAEEKVRAVKSQDYKMSDEVQSFLEKRGMSEPDFQMTDTILVMYQEADTSQLEEYGKYLSEIIPQNGIVPLNLKENVNTALKVEELSQQGMYYCGNELFAGLKKEELDYLNQNHYPKLKAYNPQECVWQKDPAYALQRQEESLSKMEDLKTELSVRVGKLLSGEYADIFSYTIDIDETVWINAYQGKEARVEIPSVIGGYPVKGILGQAFAGRLDVEEVTIPESVVSFGENIFAFNHTLVIYGESGSAAEEYAEKEEIPFKQKQEA